MMTWVTTARTGGLELKERIAKANRAGYRQDLLALLVLAGATALFFWPIWIARHRFPIGGGDLWGQLYPIWSYVAEWVRRGTFPLWSTRLMGGDPIIAEQQYGLLNPLNWPLFLVHPMPAWLISLRGTLSLWIAGTGLYLYLRRSPVWGLRATPALIGAVAYMFSDPFVAHLGHPQFNDVMAWLPWTLWGVDAAAHRRASIPWAALSVALLLVAGHAQAALYAGLFIAAYALWRIVEVPLSEGARRTGRLAMVAVLGIAMAAPALLPAVERLPYTDRAIVQPEAGEYELHLAMWRDFVSPLYHGRNVKTFWAPWDRVETGYVGVVALPLAALGFVTGLIPDARSVRTRRRTLFLVLLGIVTLLFALGTQGPLYPRLASLPLFDATWKTGRAVYLLSLVLALAAAQGSAWLLAQHRSPAPRYLWAAVVLASAALISAFAAPWSAAAPTEAAAARAYTGLTLAAAVLAATAAIGAFAARNQAARTALLLLAVTELVATGALADVEPRPIREADPHAGAIAYLRADPGWFRVDVDAKARGLWSPAAVMAAGFEVPQGTGNPMEVVAYNQYYWGIPHKGMPAYNILGAKYIIVPKGAQPGADGIWPVFFNDPLIDIHLNTNAQTRAWLVYETLPVSTLEDAYAHVFDPTFRPAEVATVTGGPALASDGTGTIELLAYRPNRARFHVDVTAPALFVLSDLRYPGWVARVDGERVPILPANTIFRGIELDAGAHTLDMRYAPRSFHIGLTLFAAALTTLGVLVYRDRTDTVGRDGISPPTVNSNQAPPNATTESAARSARFAATSNLGQDTPTSVTLRQRTPTPEATHD